MISDEIDVSEPCRPPSTLGYISYSRLRLWLTCPLAFKLKYIDGVQTPTPPAAFLGRQVHRALEHYYRARQQGVRLEATEVDRWMKATWPQATFEDGMLFGSAEEEQALLRQGTSVVGAYLNQLPASEPVPLAVEAAIQAPLVDPLSGEDFGTPLFGVVDLVLDQPASPLIVDFKTVARNGPVLDVSHELQLASYAYLFRHAFGQVEGGLEIRHLVRTKTPQILYHPVGPRSPEHLGRFFAVVRAYLDALHSGTFVYRPTLSCGMCAFREHHCVEWIG